MWGAKLVACILIDLFDMTVGRFLFPIPFAGEIMSAGACWLMFGPAGFWAGIEALDPTEQIDGFIPVATMIAMANRP